MQPTTAKAARRSNPERQFFVVHHNERASGKHAPGSFIALEKRKVPVSPVFSGLGALFLWMKHHAWIIQEHWGNDYIPWRVQKFPTFVSPIPHDMKELHEYDIDRDLVHVIRPANLQATGWHWLDEWEHLQSQSHKLKLEDRKQQQAPQAVAVEEPTSAYVNQ